MVLADNSIEDISDGFKLWFRRSNEMPTPADIVNIIERGGKPPLERSVYVNISKKEPELRDSDEWAYMREYERWAIRGDN